MDIKAADNLPKIAESARVRRKLSPADLERINLPVDLWQVKIAHVVPTAKAIIEHYLKNVQDMIANGAGLLLYGPSGAGKTSAGALVLKEARAWGYTAFFIPVWELRAAVRARTMFDVESTISDRCREVDVLLLDGVKPEDFSDPVFGGRELEELLVSRSSRRKVTILTSQITLPKMKEFRNSFPAAVEGSMVQVLVNGPSQRRQKQEALDRMVLKPSSPTSK